jgi:MFS transporter, DHA1 family, inner membrane transport protein
MKIAASWYREGLGAAMGVLIGALVLGTALPHGLRALDLGTGALPWPTVVLAVSVFATLGGLATLLLVPDNPQRVRGAPISPRALGVIWHDRAVRASVFGYFGHMWELYAFLVLVPVVLATRLQGADISEAAFWVIASGGLGCVAGGLLVRRFGSARVAAVQLATSGACALLTPWMLQAPTLVFAVWMVVWGITVAGDSPQFSTLTAQNAPREIAGSVLTFSNCIGFSITVVSIELFVRAVQAWPLAQVLPWLAVGPVIGLVMFRPLWGR